MRHIIHLLFLLTLVTTTANAELLPEAEIPVRYGTLEATYDVNADGSYIETYRWSATVLKETALDSVKNASITFSTSVAKGEILEAYTLKKGEKRIDVPKNSYQVTIDDGYEKASPLYSDETSISVIFPELAVGDTVVFASRVTNSEGMFPNQFSIAHNFSRYVAYDNVTVEINAPEGMKLNRRAFFMTEQPPVVKDGRQKLRWNYKNSIPEKWEAADVGITAVGEEPSLFVSTFNSYREITDAYGLRATPKAAVTERVKKLAEEITGTNTTTDGQARSIYDWVARNISYGGNCIGIGAVVPRDLDVVLDNRMGDCKDHATLLQALLAARNIESEQALVNAGSLYQLPPVPVVSAINHVINYVPKLNQFLDATSENQPYGLIPITLGEKPVLLVSNYREGAKIPSTAQQDNQQTMKTVIQVKEDGSAVGTIDIQQKGIPAAGTRAAMRKVPRTQEEYVASKLVEAMGLHGTATMQQDDTSALLDTYKVSLSFSLQDFMPVGTATGITIRPIAASTFPINLFTVGTFQPAPKKPTLCGGGASMEEYVIEFPKSANILAVPKDVTLSNAIIDYKATYSRDANTLNIRRELKDKTPTNICSPEYAAEYRKTMLSVIKDLKAQVLIGE